MTEYFPPKFGVKTRMTALIIFTNTILETIAVSGVRLGERRERKGSNIRMQLRKEETKLYLQMTGFCT